MEVEVIRSARRRKTVSARQVGQVLRVSIPGTMSAAQEQRWVDEMTRRFERRARADRVDLAKRADTLAARFDLPRPASIRWVDNQHARWGSCTPVDGSVRISTRLAGFPSWVLDHVIVHELAHLVEPGHGPGFKALIARDPMAERVTGFLIAKGMEGDSPDEGADPPPG